MTPQIEKAIHIPKHETIFKRKTVPNYISWNIL